MPEENVTESQFESLTEGLSGEQKAAILIVVLGEEVSTQMFEHLSKREVAKIAREVADLGTIDTDLGKAILEEYYLAAVQEPKATGGPDMARRILSRASISEEVVDQLIQEPTQSSDDVLGPLLEAPPDVLAKALEEEHPQTAALVALHLPSDKAAQLLLALPDEMRPETILRMAKVRMVKEDVLGDVATSLHERLSQAGKSQSDDDGILRTASVLGDMPRVASKAILETLEPDHPEHVQQLRDNLYTFDSLMAINDRGIQELLRVVEGSKIAMAIDGVEQELQDKLLNNLSERAAARIREEMEFNEGADESEREEARKEILASALKLESEGKLSFSERSSGDG